MFSYFLHPSRLLISGLLLLMCTFFIIPTYQVDSLALFLLSATLYFIAFFKVRKNGIEFYANRIRVRENRNTVLIILSYVLVILFLELFNVVSINENSTLLIRGFIFTPFVFFTSIFFYRVFLKK